MQEPERIEELLTQISAITSEGSYQQAIPLFEEIFVLSPGNPVALRALAKCMLQVEQHDQALALLSDSIDPDWPDTATIIQISSILKGLDRSEEAADLLVASVHANPENTDLLAEATRTLTDLGRAEEIEALTQLTQPSA
ncbi:MAG: tetratricopeptide repeat protein [Verrucomicrobiota bacterium]